jgi:lipoprotein-releasing system permease protein
MRRSLSARIERQRNILDLMIALLLRKKGKNVALLLIQTLIVFVLASVLFFSHAFREENAFLLKEAPEVVVQRIVAGRHDALPAEYLEKIKTLDGIRSVRGRLWGYYYDPVNGANYTLMVPGENPPAPGTLVLGDGISQNRLAFEGDTLEFRDHNGALVNLKIARVLPPAWGLMTSDLILLSEGDFRGLFGLPAGVFTDATVRAGESEAPPRLVSALSRLLPDTRAIPREEILDTVRSAFHWGDGMTFAVLVSSLVALGILSWDKASGLGPEERKEIAVLKAVGWELPDLIWLKLWEGLGISLFSSMTGVIAAYLHAFVLPSPLLRPLLQGWAVLPPDLRITPFVSPWQVAALFAVTVIPYTGATVLPSLKAIRIIPDEIMKA